MSKNSNSAASSPCQLAEVARDNPDYTQLGNRPAYLDFPVANTIIYCAEWEKTRYFYRHILKLSAAFSKDDWFIEFRVNDSSHLSIADAKRCSIDPGHGKGLTLSFKCSNLAELHAYLLTEAQHPGELIDQGWREPYFYLYDPEGNRIEFWQARQR